MRIEFLKCGAKSLIEWIIRLFRRSIEAGGVPEDWRNACIVQMYKDKKKKKLYVGN